MPKRNEKDPILDPKDPAFANQTDDLVTPTTKVEVKPGAADKFSKTKAKPSKTVLKQEVVAEALTGQSASQGSDAAPGIGAMRMMSYSGNGVSVPGGAADIPLRDSSTRSTSRFGKKRDNSAQHIDEVISEQTIQAFETVPSLRENPNEEEGYSGNLINSNLRVQKSGGAVPASGNFVRSLDLIKRDEIMFTDGQIIKVTGAQYYDAPTSSYNEEDPTAPTLIDPAVRGNFIPRYAHVHFNAQGKLDRFNFTVDDITTYVDGEAAETEAVLNNGSQAQILATNKVEQARIRIEAKAGDETSSGWSPLARAIDQPSRHLFLMRDIELDTGSHLYAAQRFANKSLAYQLNKGAKDGLGSVRAVNEMLNGYANAWLTSDDVPALGNGSLFDQPFYAAAAPQTLIALIDSTSKYIKKSDMLTLPRSFGMYLKQYQNFAGLFKLNSDLPKVMEKRDVFSTIDRDYDPTLPTYLLDGVNLVSTRNWNHLYSFSSLNGSGQRVLDSPVIKYGYSDYRNNYATTYTHFMLKGLADYLDEYGTKFRQLFGNSVVNIPITYQTTALQLWPFLLVGAMKHIAQERLISFREVLSYEANHGPIFDDLSGLGSIDVNNAVGYKFVDATEPLIIGRMHKSTAITWLMPELFQRVQEENRVVGIDPIVGFSGYLLPWYFNEDEVTYSSINARFEMDFEHKFFSYPECRNGVRHAGLEAVYNFTPQELRLSYDRLLYPFKPHYASADLLVHKYDLSMSGNLLAFIRDSDLTMQAYLSLPRELGWVLVAPASYVTSGASSRSTVANAYNADYRLPGDVRIEMELSYSARSYSNQNTLNRAFISGADAPILQMFDLATGRSAQFSQAWIDFPAVRLSAADRLSTGFVLSMADMFDEDLSLIAGRGTYIPFANGYTTGGVQQQSNNNALRLISLQQGLWGRLNLLQMAISPWDVVAGYPAIADDDGVKSDPLDLLYAFNFVGFRAFEYGEALYTRLEARDQLGYMYLSDVWMEKSPLFQ